MLWRRRLCTKAWGLLRHVTKVKVLVCQPCVTLWHMDYSRPVSSAHGTLQARILESDSPSVMYHSLRPCGLYRPQSSPGQNTGVVSLSLLRGIFPTQGLNPGLLQCRQILCQLSHSRRPRIPEWVASPFSSGSSQPRNGTRVSHLSYQGTILRHSAKPSSK